MTNLICFSWITLLFAIIIHKSPVKIIQQQSEALTGPLRWRNTTDILSNLCKELKKGTAVRLHVRLRIFSGFVWFDLHWLLCTQFLNVIYGAPFGFVCVYDLYFISILEEYDINQIKKKRYIKNENESS